MASHTQNGGQGRHSIAYKALVQGQRGLLAGGVCSTASGGASAASGTRCQERARTAAEPGSPRPALGFVPNPFSLHGQEATTQAVRADIRSVACSWPLWRRWAHRQAATHQQGPRVAARAVSEQRRHAHSPPLAPNAPHPGATWPRPASCVTCTAPRRGRRPPASGAWRSPRHGPAQIARPTQAQGARGLGTSQRLPSGRRASCAKRAQPAPPRRVSGRPRRARGARRSARGGTSVGGCARCGAQRRGGSLAMHGRGSHAAVRCGPP